MKTLLELVQERTSEIAATNRSSFNTNDFLLETLLNREIKRNDVIDLIVTKRLKMAEVGVDAKDFDSIVLKMYKTSKNGLDTAVSNSQNNSSFNYNPRYEGYELIKKGSTITIKKTVSKQKSK